MIAAAPFRHINSNGNFPENKGIYRNVIKCGSLFLLDKLSEVTNSLAIHNFDQEDMTGIITKH